MDVDIAGQVAEPDRQPPGVADQQAHGHQRNAERDEQAAEGHDSSIGAADHLEFRATSIRQWRLTISTKTGTVRYDPPEAAAGMLLPLR